MILARSIDHKTESNRGLYPSILPSILGKHRPQDWFKQGPPPLYFTKHTGEAQTTRLNQTGATTPVFYQAYWGSIDHKTESNRGHHPCILPSILGKHRPQDWIKQGPHHPCISPSILGKHRPQDWIKQGPHHPCILPSILGKHRPQDWIKLEPHHPSILPSIQGKHRPQDWIKQGPPPLYFTKHTGEA